VTDEHIPEPFLRSQGMQLLMDRVDPFRHLTLAALRQRRGMAAGGPGAAAKEPPAWEPLDREQLVQRLLGDGDNDDGRLLRVAFTGDAGLGKTLNLKELAFEINGGLRLVRGLDPAPAVNTRCAAFRFRLPTLPEVTNQDFERCALLPEFRLTEQTGVESLDDEQALLLLRRLRDQGRIVLLLDELDQIGPKSPAVDAVASLLKNPRWKRCPIVLAGRPYAMRIREFRKTLFEPYLSQWRFVSLDEFTPDEQRIMLGRTADGREDRYGLIHEEAHEILGVPRVLEYLRKLDDVTLRSIRTPSDVYWRAIRKMLPEDMEGSAEGCGIGRGFDERPDHASEDSVDWAMQLLGAMAYEMTLQTVGEGGTTRPNFQSVLPLKPRKKAEFRHYLDAVCRRVKKDRTEEQQRYFRSDLNKLASLNSFLDNAFFDVESPQGLTQVLWRNRTLQEFFTAWWLANFCTDDDAQRLEDWIYLPHEPLSEEYYWVWRFLTEMPDEACDDDGWVRAVKPLFRPGGGDPAKTKRSCEMIYRAWERLKMLRDDEGNVDAEQVLTDFQSEFEQILAGRFGAERQRVARDFVDHFQDVDGVPAGVFRMGTPERNQGFGPEEREFRRRQLAEWQDDPEGNAKRFYAPAYFGLGKQGKARRERAEATLAAIIRTQDLRRLENWWAPPDETPAKDWESPAIGPFALNRYPTLNAWYRLFDPQHGTRATDYLTVYERVSGSDEQPAIFVSWYDAWVFCRWACWDGLECRLPHEDEWEYVAKAGSPWEWKRWWGDPDELLAEHCTYNQPYDEGHTTKPRKFDPFDAVYQDGKQKPDGNHANPWRFIDMLGNVLEWTDDLYRREYSRAGDSPKSSARVLRGGSWLFNAVRLRSAYRDRSHPANTEDNGGCRVARALHRKS